MNIINQKEIRRLTIYSKCRLCQETVPGIYEVRPSQWGQSLDVIVQYLQSTYGNTSYHACHDNALGIMDTLGYKVEEESES